MLLSFRLACTCRLLLGCCRAPLANPAPLTVSLQVSPQKVCPCPAGVVKWRVAEGASARGRGEHAICLAISFVLTNQLLAPISTGCLASTSTFASPYMMEEFDFEQKGSGKGQEDGGGEGNRDSSKRKRRSTATSPKYTRDGIVRDSISHRK